MGKMHELPSGRMVDIENIIYISDIKKNILSSNSEYPGYTGCGLVEYSFSILWASGQKVELKFNDEDKCRAENKVLKLKIGLHTKSM